MEITRGKIPCAKKVVIYGPEGIGKSTFASQFPDPVFIDTEGSTNSMDVARLPKPTSWQMLLDEIQYVKSHPDVCKTLVIDTIDWAESMCIQSICDKHQKSGIEDFGYGNGYVYTKEEMGRFLNRLSEVVEAGVNVVLTAHAQIRKFEQPDELGAYDRWELKLGKKTSSQTSPLIKEWADMLLFANYKTFSIAVDDKGQKRKAQGGERVMYTSHHACWDAKNRYGLSEQVPFSFSSIAHIIDDSRPAEQPKVEPQPAYQVEKPKATQPAQAPVQQTYTAGEQVNLPLNGPTKTEEQKTFPAQDPAIPKALRDLMEANHVDEWDIQNVVAARGYYPADVKIRDYDKEFIDGCLIGAWQQVYQMIKEMKEKQEVPFN
ncbi:ATP-binding protein [Blautia sp. MSJ-19]|uniref:ATP-binding protein n=1 Tax=Blautia sp. MSJ-19 TaxID=2841517 RepID=UPI001C0F250F|nr:ATP-binding protein [Blautia sp. MSJ-19]MBU5481704.1 AAA family ATPase [Blautia sp. MSJ-19]